MRTLALREVYAGHVLEVWGCQADDYIDDIVYYIYSVDEYVSQEIFVTQDDAKYGAHFYINLFY